MLSNYGSRLVELKRAKEIVLSRQSLKNGLMADARFKGQDFFVETQKSNIMEKVLE